MADEPLGELEKEVAHLKGVIDPFHEVVDADHYLISESLGWTIPLPKIYLPGIGDFQITKFHVLLTLSAIIVTVLMLWLARKMKDGETPRGWAWNALEGIYFFVRDKIARAGMGVEGDPYTPFLMTLFMIILVNNMLGLIPFLGCATSNIMVTLALAFLAFCVIHISGVKDHGFGGYLKTFIPHFHLEGGPVMKIFGVFLNLGLAVLEYFTAFVRFAVLAIRLFANMLAGHVALFMILFFIQLVARPLEDHGGFLHPMELPDWLYFPVALFSIVMSTALTLLEVFIAGLQAFIFTLLTSIYIGMAKHPPH